MKWSEKVNWEGIPERMRPGITRYVEEGTRTGHFLEAIFSNNLMEACARADEENAVLLVNYAYFIRHECPPTCSGSAMAYVEWINRGGIRGNANHEPLPEHRWKFLGEER